MVSQRAAQASPGIVSHLVLYSHLGPGVQDSWDPISVAEAPLESTLHLEEIKDLTEERQGETETKGMGEEGSRQVALPSRTALSLHWGPVVSTAHTEFQHKIIRSNRFPFSFSVIFFFWFLLSTPSPQPPSSEGKATDR